jgi:hypothetical protein
MSDYYSDRLDGLPLFAPAQRKSATSVAAAREITPAGNRLRAAVLEFLRGRPAGATDEEIQTGLGMNPSTQRPRRVELVDAGLVVAAGTRRTASGRKATVWKATAVPRRTSDGR